MISFTTTIRHAISSAALFAVSSGAFAETPTIATESFTATRTRAEVVAELAAYKSRGINYWSASYNPLRQFRSATTREAVTQAFLASREEVKALNGEDSGSVYLAKGSTPNMATQMLAGASHLAQ